MPYDKPDPDNPCENCGSWFPDSTCCVSCKCSDQEFMRGGDQTWEAGYHWMASQWTCDLCQSRAMVYHRDPVIEADGVTICSDCLGAVLRGLEALRKAGLAVHGEKVDAFRLEAGQQVAEAFYAELAKAGRDDG